METVVEIMESVGDQTKQQISHFSHRHPLEHLQVEQEDGVICSGCEVQLSGSAYGCTKPSCDFILHDSCIELPQQLKHDSHPNHRLILHFYSPYSTGEFTCNGCGKFGYGFTYHCTTCKFDLHVECASLPEVEHRDDHDHPLLLLYSFPVTVDNIGKGKAVAKDENLGCYVCHGLVENGCWSYRCSGCHYGAHLDCVSN